MVANGRRRGVGRQEERVLHRAAVTRDQARTEERRRRRGDLAGRALATTAETVTVPPAAATFAGFAVNAEMTGGGGPRRCRCGGGCRGIAAAPLDVASAPVPTPARASGIAKQTSQCRTLTMDPPG